MPGLHSDRLPVISGWTFLAILVGMAVVTIGGAQILSLEAPKKRNTVVRHDLERVLILGASSGIGKELALQYAARGASLMLVARRKEALEAVAAECKAILLLSPSKPASFDGRQEVIMRVKEEVDRKVLVHVGSLNDVDSMLEARETVKRAWNGLDTVLIMAGVSSTRPFLSAAGATFSKFESGLEKSRVNALATNRIDETPKEGIQQVVDNARLTMEANYLAPTVAYATFLPVLSTTSRAPTILLMASVASLIPAPTRALYASTKSAALNLHECLALEADIQGLGVRFVSILPGTVNTDFRKNRIDLAPSSAYVAGSDEKQNGRWSKIILQPEDVAKQTLDAIDRSVDKHALVWLPSWPYRWAHILLSARGPLGALVTVGAKNKYKDGMN